MSDKIINVEKIEKGLYLLLKIGGAFSSMNVIKVRKCFEEALEIGHSRIALDLADVQLMDSMGVGLLVNMHKKLETEHGLLAIINPSDFVEKVLQASGLERVLEIHRYMENPDSLFD